jgi:hypothetical protein
MDKAVDLSSQTEKQIVENGLAIATELLPGSNTRGLLTTALTLNYFNARLEMYDQIARGAIDSSSRKVRLFFVLSRLADCLPWVKFRSARDQSYY